MASEYEIKVKGRMTSSLAAMFERHQLDVAEEPVETVLRGRFEDQAALYGLLRQVESLGLELVEVRRLPGG